jgi:hypothetical protein
MQLALHGGPLTPALSPLTGGEGGRRRGAELKLETDEMQLHHGDGGVMWAWRVLTAAVLLVALMAPVSGARAAEQIDPDALDKAKEMVTVTHSLENLDQMLGPISQSMEGLIERANPGHEKEIRDFVAKYYMPEVRRRLPEFAGLMAEEYARCFTVKELDQLIAFFRTDVGQKMVALQPKLMKDGMQLGREWGEKVAGEAYQKMLPELKKRGLKSPNI